MAEYIPTPEDSKFRKLIVLLDGTGDSVDDDMTNVAYLKDMLYERDDEKQKVLYLQGLGTAKEGTFKTLTEKLLEKAFGANFGDYVVEPYHWLAKNYRDGDKICIFGFSRGAYAARVLAGFINALGLLPTNRATHAEVEAAFALYDKSADLPKGSKTAWPNLLLQFQQFKQEKKSQEVFIEFLGCWDTVNSVGVVRAIKLSFTRTNDIVRNFRHAMALDEHRGRFKQNNWSPPPSDVPGSNDRPADKPPRCITNVEEVWFAGCHCDVGGGSVVNGTRVNLSHIPLRWMIREIFRTKSGIIFKKDEIAVLGIEPSSIYPEVQRRPDAISSSAKIQVVKPQGWIPYFASFVVPPNKVGVKFILPNKTEEELDALDALAPAYDQLVLKPFTWTYFELRQDSKELPTLDGTWKEIKESHGMKGRTVPPSHLSRDGKIKVHRTVKLRMEGEVDIGEGKVGKYVPLALVGYGDYKNPFDKAVEKGWIQWVA